MLNLPSSILTLLGTFAPLFSHPTYSKLLVLTTGHFLSKGRRTISNCLRYACPSYAKNYAEFCDIFRRASWSSFKVSQILLFLIINEWIGEESVQITVDTTLERRRGPRLHGLGMHRDAVRSTKGKKAFSPGHNWLVACILIRFPFTKSAWSLPFISILLRPEKTLPSSKNPIDKSSKRRHKKFTKYTEQIIHLLRRWLGQERDIVVIADSAFCSRQICRACQKRKITFCVAFRLDASLFSLPPPPTGRKGRTRIVGNRLPNLSEIAISSETKWKTCIVPWYGGGTYKVDIVRGDALWYHNSSGKPVPIRWLLVRDHDNPSEITPLLCTNQKCEALDILDHYIGRWSIETTFQEVRTHMGYETIHTWADKGIERVSPSLMASYSIVCLVASRAMKENNEKIEPEKSEWYNKSHVTFSDVVRYVKSLIIKENIITQSAYDKGMRKKEIYDLLYWALAA